MAAALSEENRQLNTIRFIDATRQLIDEDGLEGVSIRKIAEKAGFHNSTIYLYFKDVNQLILLASLKHFGEYSRALSAQIQKHESILDNYFAVWSFFCQTVFGKPQIFYNFFFGKYSNNLTDTILQYYDLFPEEKIEYPKEIEEMYYAKNIHERGLVFLRPLIALELPRVTSENVELVNDIIISCLQVLLEEKCQIPQADSDVFTKRLLDMIHYIIGA